jgi:DNA replication and repair protein RecF
VAAEVDSDDVVLSIGTGTEIPDAPRRLARVAGEGVPISALAEHVRPLWLTPAHDRLFADGAGDRRRFLDRLVFSWAPGHAADVSAYERSLRERTRVLGADSTDRAWLEALEAQAAKTGVRIASARAQTVLALNIEIDARDGRPFPAARIDLTGEWDRLAMDGVPANEIEAQLVRELAGARGRDGAAGRALCGPHRTDLSVVERNTGRAAAQCSTGEQKALILNLILAQAARLSRAIHVPNPILLLDEVAAHLDAERRAALFDEIDALSLQAFLTGTDEALFEAIKGRALGVRVEASSLTVAER